MKQFDNDNDELSFITLGAATLNVIRYLAPKEESPEEQREADPGKDSEKQRERARFLDTRLKEIERFEARFKHRKPNY